MPFRELVTQELAQLLSDLSHPDRIFIVEELNQGERDVKALQHKLQISHSRVSQHLSILRNHQIVLDRRQGRNVFYSLLNPQLSQWLLSALQFIEVRLQQSDQILTAVESAKELWLQDQKRTAPTTEQPEEKLIYITGRTHVAPKKNHYSK